MKPTDFAKYLTEFLSAYLPHQKNVSKNTIRSYRDTFKLLIAYAQDIKKIPAEKVTLNILSSEWVVGFLEWLETDRKSSISTRNQRLAALHSFFRYVQAEEPAGLFHFQKIVSIPSKKAKKTVVEHLTPEAIKLLLEQPDRHTSKGRRDLIPFP
jgi:integrase/recombinase XerD